MDEARNAKNNIGTAHCARYADAYEAGLLQSYLRLWRELLKGPVLRRLQIFGIQYIIGAPGAYDTAVFPVDSYSAPLNTAVYRVPGTMPYAHPFSNAESHPELGAAIARLADPTFDFSRVLVVDRPVTQPDLGEAPGRAEVISYKAGEVTITADFSAPGWLLLLESFYPGWVATIDGRALAIARANAHFMGVEVPAGTHLIRLVFAPPVQRRANRVSIAFMAVYLLALAWRAGTRHFREERP